MNNDPVISVIVPIYKVEQYLDKCVRSIISQTYTNLDIILVDDGSPDRCGEMCDSFAEADSRIRVIHKKNGGLSSARNAGMKIAKGTYWAFVDSDDWIHRDYLKAMLDAAEKYEPSIITRFSANLAQSYNRFYFENRILGEEEGVMQARLLVTKCTRDCLKTALGLLGIDAPEKM